VNAIRLKGRLSDGFRRPVGGLSMERGQCEPAAQDSECRKPGSQKVLKDARGLTDRA